MTPNPQEEQVKVAYPDADANDRTQLHADGYLWQKVFNFLLKTNLVSKFLTDTFRPSSPTINSVFFKNGRMTFINKESIW